MKQISTNLITSTIGLDVGDKRSVAVVLSPDGDVLEELKIASTRAGLQSAFGTRPACRVALEVGTHSPWMSDFIRSVGHDVYVANPRKVRLISQSRNKSDRIDAEALARLARLDPKLLCPIQHRKAEARNHLMYLRARDTIVASRTRLVNHCRAQVKVSGERLPASSTPAFANKARGHMPGHLLAILDPILQQIEMHTQTIRLYDKEIERMCNEVYPETARLRQVPGVGPLTALCFVLTLEDPNRFRKSRDIGAYLGMTPRRQESGGSAPELRITKAGDRTLRRLLVSSAHYVLGPFGPDTDLRRWGLGLAARGGKNAKKRAVVATARKLSSLLFGLWKTPREYIPLRKENSCVA
jgi:transposase